MNLLLTSLKNLQKSYGYTVKKETINSRSNKDLCIVLVRPEDGRNVGAACRAAKNMGIENLALVNPGPIDWHEAKIIAVHAVDVLNQVKIYSNVEEAVANCSLAAAITRREGKKRKYRVWTAAHLGRRLAKHHYGRVAIVFGNEKNGLSDVEIAACQVSVQIPSSPRFASLNLSHAVQIIAYEAYQNGALEHSNSQCQSQVTIKRLRRTTALLTDSLRKVGFFSKHGELSIQHFLTDIFVRADLIDRELDRLERLVHNIRGLILSNKR